MTHKDLDIWKLGIALVNDAYRETGQFPTEERFGLTTQIRRSAVSIPSNIAEGAARESRKDFLRFLYYSLGSIAELETQLIVSVNLQFLRDSNAILETIETLRRKLINFIKYQKSKLVK